MPVRTLSTNLYRLVIVLTAIYPLFYIWQGLDFTDAGFSLTNYRWMFEDPVSIETSFRIWLTNILGGLWVHVFGDSLGVAGYRFAGALVVYATLLLTYQALKASVKKEYLYPGLLFAMVFIGRSGFMLNYNTLTAFFYIWGCYYLLGGLNKSKQQYLFLSGAVLGLNTFIRLPNVLGIILGACIIFHGLLNGAPLNRTGRYAAMFLGGFAAALLAVLTTMLFLGHLDSYLASFRETFVMLEETEGHHGTGRLTGALLDFYKITFIKTVTVTAYAGILLVVLRLIGKYTGKYTAYVLITLAGILPLIIYNDFYRNWYAMVGLIAAVLFLGLALSLVHCRKRERGPAVVTGTGNCPALLAALIILLIVPAGSADGYVTSVYGMYLAIPLALQGIAGFGDRFRIPEFPYRYMVILGFVVLLGLAVTAGYRYTYRDSSQRMDMIYTVKHQKLKGVFTTRDRALVVGELLEVLPHYVGEGDYLLAYEQIPMVYFLSDTRPYLYGSWPMLYSPGKFQKMLDRAVAERPELPVIVRARGSTEKINWPRGKTLRGGYYLVGSRKIMNQFIEKKDYRKAWENSFFEILVPPGK